MRDLVNVERMHYKWLDAVLLFKRPFVKRFALCYRTVVLCPVLSVTLVYCGQTVGRIKMKLGMQVGLVPSHIFRWGPSCPQTGAQPPIFGRSIEAKRLHAWTKTPLGT